MIRQRGKNPPPARLVGVISEKRNYKGVPLVLHHGRPGQKDCEEDILEKHGEIPGHFRIS